MRNKVNLLDIKIWKLGIVDGVHDENPQTMKSIDITPAIRKNRKCAVIAYGTGSWAVWIRFFTNGPGFNTSFLEYTALDSNETTEGRRSTARILSNFAKHCGITVDELKSLIKKYTPSQKEIKAFRKRNFSAWSVKKGERTLIKLEKSKKPKKAS